MSVIMQQPTPEEEAQIEALQKAILPLLYPGTPEGPARHVVLKTLVACLISAINELQNQENLMAATVLKSKDNKMPDEEIQQIIEENDITGWKQKTAQIVLLLIGHIGDMDTRHEQLDILKICETFISSVKKTKIILPEEEKDE